VTAGEFGTLFNSELIGIEVWRKARRGEKLNLSWDTKGEKPSNRVFAFSAGTPYSTRLVYKGWPFVICLKKASR